jgi:hypothetical protein
MADQIRAKNLNQNCVPGTLMAELEPSRYLYVFLDEAGNFDFSPTGTKYFVMGAITTERPFQAYKNLAELKYDLAEKGTGLEYFHAAENAQPVRSQVFEVIRQNLAGVRIDTIVVDKCKTGPALQVPETFYPRMLGYLLRYILERHDLKAFQEVLIFTDSIPINKKRLAVEKAIKTTLSEILPATARYRIFHHESKSNYDLQIADYCTWAVYRKWSSSDTRSYEHIRGAVTSEFDIFLTGTRAYY